MTTTELLTDHEFDIAIIGMAGRFPGANSIDAFWQNLKNGKNSIKKITTEELQRSGIEPELYNDPDYIKYAPVIDYHDQFDPRFFGMTPREAATMDPQQRLFLECAWDAFENAGYNPQTYEKPVAVYGGAAMNTYFTDTGLDAVFRDEYLPTLLGNDNSFLATRVSYKLNLTGPSVTVQTACSTGLVAVHMACQSLLSHECDMALAGGVSVKIPHLAGYMYKEGSPTSASGYCRPFDARADGTVFGSGAGIVLLKRYREAVESGDHIYALIKGSAINNDGSDKTQYTAPSVNRQSDVILEALSNADVNADSISYLEAHGTGTYLGDPIEVRALTKAYRHYTSNKQFCALGSVKSNIGHLDAAAGIAGLIKTALSLKNRALPPTLHFNKQNPEIDFNNSPFYVNNKYQKWQINGNPLRAGITSLGIGGTNAHVILEGYYPSDNINHRNKPELFVFSARTPEALHKMTDNLSKHLPEIPENDLPKVAWTLQNGRKEFPYRHTVVTQNRMDVAKKLQESFSVDKNRVDKANINPEVIFMFPGQGAQYVDMAKQLYENEPFFRNKLDQCADLFEPHINLDLRDILYPQNSDEKEQASELLQNTRITQPAMFAIQYGLAKLWMHWGVQPDMVVGHSSGEYGAACVAGVLSLEDAIFLVALRGKLMASLPEASMLSIALPPDEVEPLLNDQISLASVNSKTACVVSGETNVLVKLHEELTTRDIGCRLLHTSVAGHSYLMDPILDHFRKKAEKVEFQIPKIPTYSSILGALITDSSMSSVDYWVKNIRNPVQFADTIEIIKSDNPQIFLEVGPGRTLGTFVRQHLGSNTRRVILQSLRHPKNSVRDDLFILDTIGKIWAAGKKVDWQKISKNASQGKIPLPTYPYDRQRCWFENNQKERAGELPHNNSGPFGNQSRLYRPVWQQSGPHYLTNGTCRNETWLIFNDIQDMGGRVAKHESCKPHRYVTVRVGKYFRKEGKNAYEIDPGNAEHYLQLINDLREDKTLPDRILHTWSIERVVDSDSEALFKKSQERGFYSLLYLAKALDKYSLDENIALDIITNELHAVTGLEQTEPGYATLIGIRNVLPVEYPGITCRNIDISGGDSDRLAIINQLAHEISRSYDEGIVALRGKKRWKIVFDSVAAPSQQKSSEHSLVSQHSTYLVTGGLGDAGYYFAEYLAESARVNLVILGRTKLPPKEEWAQFAVKNESHDMVAQKVQKLLTLESKTHNVLYFQADLGDKGKLATAIKNAEEQLGTIHGIIHAAGDVSVVPIPDLAVKNCEQYFAPKVHGTMHLAELFAGKKLDFWVNISSVSSFLGGYGFAGYAASNSFMDAYTRQLQADLQIKRFTTINWDAIESSTTTKWMDKESLMTKEQVKMVLSEILTSGLAGQLVVTKAGDLQQRMNLGRRTLNAVRAEISNSDPVSEELSEPQSQEQEHLLSREESMLLDIWREYLGTEEVSVNDDFFELGGSSLTAVQIFNRIRKKTGISIPMAKIFDHSTISSLAGLMMDDEPKSEREKIKI